MQSGATADLIDFAMKTETAWPRDLTAGNLPGLTEIEPPPWNAILGPLFPRGGPSGIVLKRGEAVAQWGEPANAAILPFRSRSPIFPSWQGVALG